jgi:Cyclic nucleotide-binding domain
LNSGIVQEKRTIESVANLSPRLRGRSAFQPADFLAHKGLGRTIVDLKKHQTIFSQGDAADAVFYVQKGRVKLTVISKRGKEATIALLGAGEFLGEECIAAIQPQRMATATTITPATILRIERKEMIRVLHEEQLFSEVFVSYLLTRNARIQEDLVDHLFNSSEKAPGPGPVAARPIRQGRHTGDGDSQNEPGNAGGDDRHNPLTGKLLHESLPQTRVY